MGIGFRIRVSLGLLRVIIGLRGLRVKGLRFSRGLDKQGYILHIYIIYTHGALFARLPEYRTTLEGTQYTPTAL